MTAQALDEIKIGGMGASRKRVEDNRFIRGKGNYIDDIVLPGMLHMEILRSPLAHARIKSIDASKAWDIPGVHLVLTGEMMATRNLAWMPTLSYDTQAVLATDKVRFQGQEVAFVIATDEYSANDALQLIDVEYEPLPAIVNARKALDPDAPLIRDDKAGQRDNLASPTWEAGDQAATDRAFAEADYRGDELELDERGHGVVGRHDDVVLRRASALELGHHRGFVLVEIHGDLGVEAFLELGDERGVDVFAPDEEVELVVRGVGGAGPGEGKQIRYP